MWGNSVGPWHFYTHPGSGFHASGAMSAEDSLNSDVEIMSRKPAPRACSSRSPAVKVVVNRRDVVGTASRTAVRKHTNTVKQRTRTRGALWAALWLAQLMLLRGALGEQSGGGTGAGCSSGS